MTPEEIRKAWKKEFVCSAPRVQGLYDAIPGLLNEIDRLKEEIRRLKDEK